MAVSAAAMPPGSFAARVSGVVDFIDCSGRNYTFLARRGNGLFRVRVTASGRVLAVSPARRY